MCEAVLIEENRWMITLITGIYCEEKDEQECQNREHTWSDMLAALEM